MAAKVAARSGGGGGVGGQGGDGGDASPIVGARCEFIVGDDIENGNVLYSAALADFLDDGRLGRSDLSMVTADIDSVLHEYDPQEIQSAFESIFPAGIGTPYDDITDENGNYFIPVPPNVPGFVRCIPPDREQLVLATYVPERQVSEILLGQDVNPATTLFSVEVAPKLSGNDVAAAKENFLKNIDGINVYIREKQVDGSGVLTFSLCAPPPGEVDPPDNCVLNTDNDDSEMDNNVGMMAFSATSIFNSFYKNNINGDFLSALSDLSQNGEVPAAELQASGVPTAQVTELSRNITDHAEIVLNTGLKLASQTARVKVTVTDVPGGTGIDGATVDSTSSYACTGCGGLTDANGQITLTFTGVPSNATNIEIVADGVPGYVEAKKTVTVSASSTVNLDLAMDNASPVVKILSPTTSSAYTTGSRYLSISGTATDDVNVTQVTWVNDRGGSGTCVGTANWSTSDVTLALGTNQISILALDTAGNTGFATLTVTYQLIAVPIFPRPVPIAPIVPVAPTVTITAPTSEATYTTYLSPLKISGTATDDKGISRVTWVSQNGRRVDSGVCLTTTKVDSSGLTVGWSASGVPLTLGTNEVIVTAEDMDGNTGSRTLTVTLKTLSIVPILPVLPTPIPIVNLIPSVTITSPTTAAEYTTFVSSVNITGTATDDGGVTQVIWTNTNGATGTCVGTADWSTGDISLALGLNEITITAYDGAGNTGTASLNVTYQLPTIVPIFPVTPIITPIIPLTPSVAITSPTTEADYTTFFSTVNITGTAIDDGGVTQVTWTNTNGATGTCAGTADWVTGDISLALGLNEITITAYDGAGNTGTASLNVMYQLPTIVPIFPVTPIITPIIPLTPSVAITSPTTEADYTTFFSTVNITGTAIDDGGVTQVTWTNANGASGTCVGTANWSTGDISLALGLNEITITAYDGAGNTGTASLSVTYQLPTIVPIFPVTPIISPIEPLAPK